MTVRPARILATAACVFAAGLAGAQTLYKLIDKNGKVTYSESAPKDFDGKVIRIDIDPNRNSATLPPVPRGGVKPAPGNEERVRESKDKLERARKALADAREHPGEDDVQRVGKVGGGARPVPSDAYRQRLADLERAVKEAEDELEKSRKIP